jgi:hypothetical protein
MILCDNFCCNFYHARSKWGSIAGPWQYSRCCIEQLKRKEGASVMAVLCCRFCAVASDVSEVSDSIFTIELCRFELSLSYCRRSVDQFVLVSGSPLGPMTRFYPYPFSSDNCFVALPAGRPLWREDGSVIYSAIADWSGHWGPVTIHYRLIWDYVPSSSPLTTLRDCGGDILTRLHTGKIMYHTSM